MKAVADQFPHLHPSERELLKLAEAKDAWAVIDRVPALLSELSRLRGALTSIAAFDDKLANERLAKAGGGQVVIGCSICGQYHPGRTCPAPQDGGPSPLFAAMAQAVQDIARSSEAFEQIRRDSIRALHDQTPIISPKIEIHSSAKAESSGRTDEAMAGERRSDAGASRPVIAQAESVSPQRAGRDPGWEASGPVPEPTSSTLPAPGTEDGGALLPCPFCGGVAAYMTADEAGPDAYVVTCMQCHASSAVHYAVKESPREKAIAAWNRRAAPSAPAETPGLLKRLYALDPSEENSAPAPTGEVGGLAVTWAKLRRQGWAITGELANAGDKMAAELTRLTAEVERLTRERDEARGNLSTCEFELGQRNRERDDANHQLDGVLDVLGIAETHCDPADAIREWIVRAEAAEVRAARAEEVVEAVENFLDCNPEPGGLARHDMRQAVNEFRAATPSGEGGGR